MRDAQGRHLECYPTLDGPSVHINVDAGMGSGSTCVPVLSNSHSRKEFFCY